MKFNVNIVVTKMFVVDTNTAKDAKEFVKTALSNELLPIDNLPITDIDFEVIEEDEAEFLVYSEVVTGCGDFTYWDVVKAKTSMEAVSKVREWRTNTTVCLIDSCIESDGEVYRYQNEEPIRLTGVDADIVRNEIINYRKTTGQDAKLV